MPPHLWWRGSVKCAWWLCDTYSIENEFFCFYYISEHVVCACACVCTCCFHTKLCWDENNACGWWRPPPVWPIAMLLCLHGNNCSSMSLLSVWGRCISTANRLFLFLFFQNQCYQRRVGQSLPLMVSTEMVTDVPRGGQQGTVLVDCSNWICFQMNCLFCFLIAFLSTTSCRI